MKDEKKCRKCKEVKCKSLFYGVQGECKECTKKAVKANASKVGRGYDFSERGVLRVIYKTQKRNNNLRGYGEMPYTKQELVSWMYANGYKEKFDEWVESGRAKDLKPSVDRVNDLKGYSFDNIQLLTWKENKEHQYSDKRSGIGTSGKQCKPLLKLDTDMNVICEFVSYSSAVRDAGYSLEYQIKNNCKCRNGFYWKYK